MESRYLIGYAYPWIAEELPSDMRYLDNRYVFYDKLGSSIDERNDVIGFRVFFFFTAFRI